MKQAIIEKLFNGEELESSEILHVTKSLNFVDDSSDYKPYNHSLEQVFQACSISESDADDLSKNLSNVTENTKSISQIVEHCEKLIESNSSYKRLIIIQAIKYMKASNDPFMRLFMGL